MIWLFSVRSIHTHLQDFYYKTISTVVVLFTVARCCCQQAWNLFPEFNRFSVATLLLSARSLSITGLSSGNPKFKTYGSRMMSAGLLISFLNISPLLALYLHFLKEAAFQTEGYHLTFQFSDRPIRLMASFTKNIFYLCQSQSNSILM